MSKNPPTHKAAVYLTWLGLLFLTTQIAWGQFYDRRHAVVIGINQYNHSAWRNLNYAGGDALAVANMLKQQNFTVYSLYDVQATRAKIISLLEDRLAPILMSNDAFLFFFAGHGTTRSLGGEDWGYIVPADGTNLASTYIDMEEIRKLSRKMGTARHQLFVMDCCYGGKLLRGGGSGIPTSTPSYLKEVSRRKARQILTAGGKNQEVVDGGPYGHSVFTGYFLKAIQAGEADLDRNGWVTFNELTTYLIPAASSSLQTPGYGNLPGHEQGEFLFSSKQTLVVNKDGGGAPNVNEGFANNNRRSYGEQKQLTTVSDLLKGEQKQPDRGDKRPDFTEVSRAIQSMRIFRSQPAMLSEQDVGQMLQQQGFFCKQYDWNKNFSNEQTRGFANDFHVQPGGEAIYDRASARARGGGLMWQQSGSQKILPFSEAQKYINELNRSKFASFSDWRLPTLEEAMSLIEAQKNEDGLYIDRVFNKTQSWIWTSDKDSASRAWVVYFDNGFCSSYILNDDNYVRAVR